MISALLPVLCSAPEDFFRSLPPTRDLLNIQGEKTKPMTVSGKFSIDSPLSYIGKKKALIWFPIVRLEYAVVVYISDPLKPSAVLSVD